MGLNIYLVRFADDGGDSDEDFDSKRYSGDKEFVMAMTNHCRCRMDKYAEEVYWRPVEGRKGFGFARQWIAENIFEDNQRRLFDLLDRLETDENLWVQSVW